MPADRELKAMETTLGALQPLDADEQQRVVSWLAAKLGLDGAAPAVEQEEEATRSRGSSGTIKQFLVQKKPPDDVARATTLAYFLTHEKNQTSYKSVDLTKAGTDAALVKFNMSRAIANAQRAGYLTTAGKRGMYQITATGEAVVEALPDTELVKKVKAQGGRRRKRTPAKKKPAAKKAATPKK